MGWISRILGAMDLDAKPSAEALRPPSGPGKAAGRVTPVVTLTEGAAARVREIVEESQLGATLLRISVKVSDDGAYMHEMGFDDQVDPYQNVRSDSNGIPIAVPIENIPLLKGTIIDFVDNGEQTGFWFQNPNAI